MRWSLVLSALIAVQSTLSFVCVALPISTQSDELERRAPARRTRRAPSSGLKLASKKYRTNSKDHPIAYHVTGLAARGKLADGAKVERKVLRGKGEKHGHANKLLASKAGPIHADHVFEAQMLDHHLKKHNIDFSQMHPGLQKKVKNILNHPKNMALIPGSINQSKGQLIKQGMQGKKVKPQKARDQYAKLSYGTAHKTAGKLDEALKAHPGYSKAVRGDTLQQKLKDTFVSAGLHRPTPPPKPSTPVTPPSTHSNLGPAGLSPNRRRRGTKRQVSPGNSPPKKRGARRGSG